MIVYILSERLPIYKESSNNSFFPINYSEKKLLKNFTESDSFKVFESEKQAKEFSRKTAADQEAYPIYTVNIDPEIKLTEDKKEQQYGITYYPFKHLNDYQVTIIQVFHGDKINNSIKEKKINDEKKCLIM